MSGEQLPLARPTCDRARRARRGRGPAGAARRARAAARSRRGRCRHGRVRCGRRPRGTRRCRRRARSSASSSSSPESMGNDSTSVGPATPMWSRLRSAIAASSTNSTFASPGPLTDSAASTAATRSAHCSRSTGCSSCSSHDVDVDGRDASRGAIVRGGAARQPPAADVRSYASTMSCTIRCRTTSRLVSCTNARPVDVGRGCARGR